MGIGLNLPLQRQLQRQLQLQLRAVKVNAGNWRVWCGKAAACGMHQKKKKKSRGQKNQKISFKRKAGKKWILYKNALKCARTCTSRFSTPPLPPHTHTHITTWVVFLFLCVACIWASHWIWKGNTAYDCFSPLVWAASAQVCIGNMFV